MGALMLVFAGTMQPLFLLAFIDFGTGSNYMHFSGRVLVRNSRAECEANQNNDQSAHPKEMWQGWFIHEKENTGLAQIAPLIIGRLGRWLN